MELKDLVKLIAGEVLKQLYSPSQQEVLVLLTGGRSVWSKVRYKLEELANRGFRMNAVISDSAGEMFDTGQLHRIFGTVNRIEYPEILPAVKKASLVLLPTLTVNTAAKLANGIQDNRITAMAGWAMMAGKPVVAVSNAADPESPELRRLGLGEGSPQYISKLKDNLHKLSSFGVTLTDVDYLLPVVIRMLEGNQSDAEKKVRVEGVVTRAKVLEAARNQASLVVAGGAPVTPLAMETAAAEGVTILHE